MGGVGGEFSFGFGNIDAFYEVKCEAFNFLEIVVVVEEGSEFIFTPVEANKLCFREIQILKYVHSHTAATLRLMSTSLSTLISPKVCFLNRALRRVLPHPATGQGAGP